MARPLVFGSHVAANISVACDVANPPRALIADDHGDVIHALRLLLKGEGYHVEGVSSPAALLQALGQMPFDLVIVDLNYTRDTTSGREGLELVARIRELDREVPVVAMTAWGTIDLAVDAMRLGVDDFIQKPWDNSQLVQHLRRHLQAGRVRREQQRVHAARVDAQAHELAAARDIQRALLPTRLPAPPGADIVAFWEPAGEVGGDFYDAVQLDAQRTWLCVGDVAGKGVSAALLMANVLALARSAALASFSPAAVCAAINQELSTRIAAGRFVTFFHGVYDASQRQLVYSNAGHCAPMLVRKDGTVAWLTQGGAVLGVFPGCSYQQGAVRLSDGDRLVVFTDGITEGRNAEDDEFTEARLSELAVEHRSLTGAALCRKIVEAAKTFCGGRFEDDATLIVVGT